MGLIMRIILAAALTIGFTSAADAADCSALQIKNTIKMEPVARLGLMMVPITLNGVEKKFLFDTGGAINSISRATVAELKLPEYHSNYRTSDLYGGDSNSFVQVRDVIFGTGKTGGIQFQVMSNLALDNGIAPFDGILSTGVFAHDDFDLDFGAERVNFFSTDHCEGRVVYWPHQVLAVVPMRMEQGHINVPITLDGHPLRAILDTGSTRTNLNIVRAQEKLSFLPDAPAPPDTPKGDPDNKVYPRRFSTLSFEGVTVSNPLIVIRPLQFGGGKNDATVLGSRAQHEDDQANRLSPDMIIGMDILRHLHVYIATNEQKLYITEAGTGESPLFKNTAASANGP
jgi:hypothetical protein